MQLHDACFFLPILRTWPDPQNWNAKPNLLWHSAVKMSQNGDNFCLFIKLGMFSLKFWQKHTFCYWEHDQISVIEMGQITMQYKGKHYLLHIKREIEQPKYSAVPL